MGRTGTLSRWILGVLLVLVLLWRMLSLYGNRGLGASYVSHYSEDARRPLNPALLSAPGAPPMGNHIADSLALAVHRRDADADGVFTADITVTNKSATAIKDVAIACDALNDNGATIGHAGMTLHELFAAHDTKTIVKVTPGFLQRHVASATCSIVTFGVPTARASTTP